MSDEKKRLEAYPEVPPYYGAIPQMAHVVQVKQPGYDPQTVYTDDFSPLVVGEAGHDPQISKLRNYNLCVVIFSIIHIIGCCNLCIGIPSLVLAILGREDFSKGRKEEGKLKTGIAFGLLLAVTLIALGILIYSIVLVTVVMHSTEDAFGNMTFSDTNSFDNLDYR